MKPRKFQAIVTKFLPVTDRLPSRVKATAEAGSVTITCGGEKGYEDLHQAAAEELARKFGWKGHWYGARLPGGKGDVYVCADTLNTADGETIPSFIID